MEVRCDAHSLAKNVDSPVQAHEVVLVGGVDLELEVGLLKLRNCSKLKRGNLQLCVEVEAGWVLAARQLNVGLYLKREGACDPPVELETEARLDCLIANYAAARREQQV